MISSESTLSWVMTLFWSASIFSARCRSWRAGAPRRIASFRFSGLPASAVPNSLIRSESRCLYGIRSVFATRSFCTVWLTSFGTVAPSGSASPAGWQLMKYSAISDCGSDEHVVLSPRTDRGPESSTVRTARFSSLMSSSVTVPALTPATLTSDPSTRPNALYISSLYVWLSSAPATLAATAPAAAIVAAMAAIRLMGPWEPARDCSPRRRRRRTGSSRRPGHARASPGSGCCCWRRGCRGWRPGGARRCRCRAG